MMYNVRSDAIPRQIPDFVYDGDSNVSIFPAFSCQNSDLESLTLLVQGHVIQVLQSRHLMANVKIYKRNFFTFFIFFRYRKTSEKRIETSHKISFERDVC